MAFFRKWKTHYKHKKFTSDEATEGEDWGLEKPTGKDVTTTNMDDMKLDLHCLNNGDDDIDGDDSHDKKLLFATYDIKYLGCTPIETKRSEKATSDAIKTVIANSKAGGRKNKTQKRVKLNVSQDGIEVIDYHTQDTLMRFSIYKISYCSVDAAHDHMFSFVGSETVPLSDKEKLSCHVFHCSKRKIAHEITLMVARCFENAYQHWRDTVVQHAKSQGMNFNDNNVDVKKVLKEQNGVNVNINGTTIGTAIGTGVTAEVYHQQKIENKIDNPLIDLAATDNDVRKFLQKSWVSFEDDSSVHIAAY